MIDCPCGFAKDIKEDRPNCPVCGTDLTPLHRLRGLPRKIQEEGLRLLDQSDRAGAAEKLSAAVSLDPGLEEARRALDGLAPARKPAGSRRSSAAIWLLALAGFVLGAAIFALFQPAERKPESVGGPDAARRVQTALAGQPSLSGCPLKVEATAVGILLAGDVPTEIHKDLILLVARTENPGAEVDDRNLRVVPSPEKPEPPTAIFYTVKTGDTLGTIAERFFGHADRWTRIFEANRPALSNAHAISPGQSLAIPLDGLKIGTPAKIHKD